MFGMPAMWAGKHAGLNGFRKVVPDSSWGSDQARPEIWPEHAQSKQRLESRQPSRGADSAEDYLLPDTVADGRRTP